MWTLCSNNKESHYSLCSKLLSNPVAEEDSQFNMSLKSTNCILLFDLLLNIFPSQTYTQAFIVCNVYISCTQICIYSVLTIIIKPFPVFLFS